MNYLWTKWLCFICALQTKYLNNEDDYNDNDNNNDDDDDNYCDDNDDIEIHLPASCPPA